MDRNGPRNIRLECFLKRNLERAELDRVRTYEPCVVTSETVNRTYMHVVLSEERVYLTEFPPRTLTVALSLRHVHDIELVHDVPDFLRGKDQDLSQHIRISYRTDRPGRRRGHWLSRGQGAGLPPVAPPSRTASRCSTTTQSRGSPAHRIHGGGVSGGPMLSSHLDSHLRVPGAPPDTSAPPCPRPPQRLELPEHRQRSRWFLSHLFRREAVRQERRAELHLYAVSPSSTLYLHLQSAWDTSVIRSTLMLDPLRCRTLSDSAISAERTSQLFSQLISELQQRLSVERLSLLLTELLSNTSLASLIVQMLSVMIRETSSSLLCDRGVLVSRLLLVLVSDPGSEVSPFGAEYLDAVTALLFQLMSIGLQMKLSRCSSDFLSPGWILGVLQPHPHLTSFMGYQAQQVVQVLSDLQNSFLSPVQSVLLFQRCRLLLVCLQNHGPLAQHLRSHFREEFRYCVRRSCGEEKLPGRYPISRAARHLLEATLTEFHC